MIVQISLKSISGCSHNLSLFLLLQLNGHSFTSDIFEAQHQTISIEKDLIWEVENTSTTDIDSSNTTSYPHTISVSVYRYSRFFINSLICSEELSLQDYKERRWHQLQLCIGFNFRLDLELYYENAFSTMLYPAHSGQDCSLNANSSLIQNTQTVQSPQSSSSNTTLPNGELPVIVSFMSPLISTFSLLSRNLFPTWACSQPGTSGLSDHVAESQHLRLPSTENGAKYGTFSSG